MDASMHAWKQGKKKETKKLNMKVGNRSQDSGKSGKSRKEPYQAERRSAMLRAQLRRGKMQVKTLGWF